MPNRTLCSVLEEMRKCNETRNYTFLLDLNEEVNELFLRMVISLNEFYKLDKPQIRETDDKASSLK